MTLPEFLMRRTFSALVFFSCLGMLTACVNDVEPVSVAPPAPWTAGDYSLVVEVSAAEAAAGDVVTITSRHTPAGERTLAAGPSAESTSSAKESDGGVVVQEH